MLKALKTERTLHKEEMVESLEAAIAKVQADEVRTLVIIADTTHDELMVASNGDVNFCEVLGLVDLAKDKIKFDHFAQQNPE